MTATGITGSWKAGVHMVPACRFHTRPGLWTTRFLGNLFSWFVRRESFSKAPLSSSRASGAGSDPYLSALATAETVEQSLRLMNKEIDEIESRLQKLALF